MFFTGKVTDYDFLYLSSLWNLVHPPTVVARCDSDAGPGLLLSSGVWV